jgi:SAM-dependent methyltransferase
MEEVGYDDRLAADLRYYEDREVVHDLPPIFHHWSHTHLRPLLEPFGIVTADGFFKDQCAKAIAETPDRVTRCVSIGAGNCDAEVRLALSLNELGVGEFRIECLDINPEMLSRGREMAAEAGLEGIVVPVQADFNEWKPSGPYDVVLANQALHHVMNLEGLFAAVSEAIGDSGYFIASDMIGRNGHLRWPEALELVQAFWHQLPPSFRFNVQLQRHEEEFQDWDCSKDGFEGIRAQDILPLLVERFDFEVFLPFGNLIDPFIDRSFGPHFDPEGVWDRAFIDRVHHRDEREMHAGRITPTHMLAVMRPRPFNGRRVFRGLLTPEFCVRRPD